MYQQKETARRGEWRHGWRAVLGSSIGLGTGYGLYAVVASVFVKPMAAEFGWTRAELAFAPIVGLVAAFLYPLAGGFADRFGTKRTAMCGLGAMSLCYLGVALLPASRSAWLVWAFILGMVAPFTGYVVFLGAVVRAFDHWRGTALAITMCGISVISALVLPLLQFVINALGWRWGYGLLGLLIIGCGLPVVLVALQNENGTITRRDGAEPVEARREPGPNLRQALARIDFWLLALAFILSAIPLGGYIGNLQPLLTDAGASPAIAALIGSIFALSMLGGQLVSGPLLDRFHPHIVAAAFLFLPGLAALMLSRVGDGLAPGPAVVIAIVIIGVAQGALVNFIGFFVARHFGVKHYALIFGVLIAGVGLGMSAGGLGFAWSFDRHGNYSLASLCSALGFVLAGVFMLRSARQKSVAATMVADLRS